MVSKIIGIGVALPPHAYNQSEIFQELGYNRHFWPLFHDSGIEHRHFAVPLGDIKHLNFQDQQEWYRREGFLLSVKAAGDCFDRVSAADLGMIISAHCTAFGFPGPTLAHAVGHKLGCGTGVFFENIASMGCEGGFPGLKRAWDFHFHDSKPVLVVACELSSCSYYPEPGGADPENDYDLVRANAIFGDAAAAILVGSDEDPRHPAIVDAVTYTDDTYRHELGYGWRNGRLRIRLGRRVPEIAAGLVEKVLSILLIRHCLLVADIAHWIIHPAGRQVLDVIRDTLGISEENLAFSREALRQYGNCSSASIGLVGKNLMDHGDPRPGDYGVIVSLGPGVTAGATLLRWG